MDTTVVIVVAVVILAAAVAAFFLMRRRPAKVIAKPLSTTSEDRTFVGIGAPSRVSDATMVGPAVAPTRSDATVVDVRATAPAAAPVAPSPAAPPVAPPATAPADAPTVAMNVPRADTTAPTIRIPKLRARVTVTKGGSGTYELEAREHTIGRSTHADIVLADPSVSGQHAKLSPRGDAFAISDLGSTNGTTVEGQPVKGEVLLRGGETVGIGDARLRYERLT